MFYEFMNIDVNQTIAIVIDAASISLIEILSRGKFTGKRPTVYYIYGPEVEHDPATKKHPASSDFREKEEGVILIPCVSLNPASFVYSYSYIPDDPSGLYLNQFFTNFQFDLSELRSTPKGKTVEYSTDLTIKAFDRDGKIKFIDESIDSKSKSDITFLTKIIEALKSTLQTGSEKDFQYAVSFLKKMSGDWLQVLLTKAISDRTRGFTPYGKPRENITAKIDRVFFVTHDQIALSFALLMGVESLFTHHGPVSGNPSLHSAFLFSLSNEADVNASLISKADKVVSDYSTEIAGIRGILSEYIKNYDIAINALITDLTSNLDGYLDAMQKRLDNKEKTMLAKNFDTYVQNIFSIALKMVATKKLLPDLRIEEFSIETLEKSNTELKSKIDGFKTNKTPDAAKELLELDGKIGSGIKNLKKIVESAKDLFLIESEKAKMNLKDKIAEFTKTLIYSSANKWTWDSPEVSNRALSKLTNYGETKDFNADRNIFLYNLDSLDDEFKQKITNLFAKCYLYISKGTYDKFTTGEIKNNKPVSLTSYQFQKYKVMTETFCYEVFLNFGTFGKGDDATPEKVLEYSESIISANELLVMWDDITNEETKYKEELAKGPNHLDESVLLKQMNEIDIVLDNKIESFEKSEEDKALEETTQTTPPKQTVKKQSKISMTFNSVNVACKLLTHRLLSNPLPRGGGYAGGSASRIQTGGNAQLCNFHYLLPIEILLFQLSKTLCSENYKESLDFELVLQFYDFLLRMKDEAVKVDEKDAYKIGLGIRDLFFIQNNLETPSAVLSVMPQKMLSMMKLITTRFCGLLINVEPEPQNINNPVFKKYIEDIKIADCFNTDYDLVLEMFEYNEFVKVVSSSTIEVAKMIIDTSREESNLFSNTVFEPVYKSLSPMVSTPSIKSFGGKKTSKLYSRKTKRQTRKNHRTKINRKTRRKNK